MRKLESCVRQRSDARSSAASAIGVQVRHDGEETCPREAAGESLYLCVVTPGAGGAVHEHDRGPTNALLVVVLEPPCRDVIARIRRSSCKDDRCGLELWGNVLIALSGDGGDELFAGYNRHIWASRIWGVARAVPQPIRSAGAPFGPGL